MMSFRGDKIARQSYGGSTTWLLEDLGRHQGLQELYSRQSPQALRTLREHALIQSAESSNRIEGVTVSPDRLAPLILGDARPRDRSEQEVQGYRDALNQIHTNSRKMAITPELLLELHDTIQAGAGDAGEWKHRDNDIVELRAGMEPLVRFRTVPAAQAVAAIDELCLAYRNAVDQVLASPLILLSAFVLDFLCIHPFRDGNGRISRLLTLITLYQHGYEVGRYISLEKLVEDSKEDYYEALRRSSVGWHEGSHELIPWTNYLLSVVRRACVEFEDRVGQLKSAHGAKSEMVATAIRSMVGEFSLSEIERVCPGVSRDTVRSVAQEMQKRGEVECIGRGPGAKWRRKS